MQEHKTIEELLILPSQASRRYFHDLVSYRELLYFFVWRDLLVRYKQAVFGVGWALFRPLLNMAVFAFVFGKVARFSADQHLSYGLFVLAATLPWQFFASSVVDGTNGLINHSHLISKTYFPRILLPLSQILVNLVDFAIATLVLIGWGALTQQLSPWFFLTSPLAILLACTLTSGMAFWLSALTVRYRDFKIIVPFFVQFGMFISPVGYGTSAIPESWRWVFALNPMVGVIDSFRWTFLEVSYPGMGWNIFTSVAISLTLLATGFCYFRKMERSFADEI